MIEKSIRVCYLVEKETVDHLWFTELLNIGEIMEERKYTVSYSNLWKLLIDRKIKKTELKANAKISPGTYAKLNKDQFVSMDVIARICSVLDCKVEDVLELILEDGQKSESKGE